MDKLTPRAIIFDLGSTLIEYEAVPWDELGIVSVEHGRKYLKRRGLAVAETTEFLEAFNEIKTSYRKEAAKSFREWDVPMVVTDLFGKYGFEVQEKLIDGFFDAYYEKVAEQLYVYDDTVETMARLKNRYPVIGLVSNTIFPERVHRKELDRFGLAGFLNFAVFSSTMGIRKPHADIFLSAVNQAGCAPSECVYIGDRYLEDIEGPKGLGMSAILKVKKGREYPAEMLVVEGKPKTCIKLLRLINVPSPN